MPSTVAAKRMVYRLAFWGLQLQSTLQRHPIPGVKCVITDGDHILLVRHSYGSRAWDLPGGRSKRNEDPVTTARREMEEELGLGDVDWKPRGEVHQRRIKVVHAEVSSPALRVDPVEIDSAAWFERDRLPLWVSPFVGPVLAGALGHAASGG